MTGQESSAEPDEIAPWFWAAIEACRPQLARLAAWLEASSRGEIERFALSFELAKEEVVPYWEGPNVDGIQFSEDDTEDLCSWVVSQGHDFWRDVLKQRHDLSQTARSFMAAEMGANPAHPLWSAEGLAANYAGYHSPTGLPACIYERRYSTSLLDVLSDPTRR